MTRHSPQQAGFTLLEIMLVILLLGLATSVAVPTLMPKDGSAELQRTAERFAALVETAHEEAMLMGQDLGIVINDNDYQFVQFTAEGWEELSNNRLLRPVTLEDGFRMSMTPGESVWHSTLAQMQQDTLLEDWFQTPEEMLEPDLYIWSSGDLTPASVEFSRPRPGGRNADNNPLSFNVTIEETGDVYLQEENQS